MIILIDGDNEYDKNLHPFVIKTLNKLVLEGDFLILIKNISEKPTANITLNGETLNAFPLRQGTSKDVLSYHSYSILYCKS